MLKLLHLIKCILFYASCYAITFTIAFYLVIFGNRLNAESKSRITQKAIGATLRMVKAFFGITIKTEYESKLPDKACVVMANHQSSLETFFLQLLAPPMSVVLKKKLVQSPILRRAFSIINPIPLDRRKPTKAYKDLLAQGKDRLENGQSVLIFPEGTRVKVGENGRINRGAASLAHLAQVPLVPVAHNAGLLWPPKLENGFATKQDKVITVRVGSPIDSTQYSINELNSLSSTWLIKQRDHLASNIHNQESCDFKRSYIN